MTGLENLELLVMPHYNDEGKEGGDYGRGILSAVPTITESHPRLRRAVADTDNGDFPTPPEWDTTASHSSRLRMTLQSITA